MLRIAMSAIMRCQSGVTCTFITELPSVGLHTGAILTDQGSNETRASLSKASRKGRETTIVRRIGNGSTEPYSLNPRLDYPPPLAVAHVRNEEPKPGTLTKKAAAERRQC